MLVIPLKARPKKHVFDLFEELDRSLKEDHHVLKTGDVLVISSKYMAYSQGRVVKIDSVMPSSEGRRISRRYKMDPQLAEIILRESDMIFGGMAGFVITSTDGIMAPNAGIDRSNVENGKAVLYPVSLAESVEQIRRKIFLRFTVNVGVIVIDSRLMPGRVGTTGIALGCAGIEPILDMRATKDLEGKPLKVTLKAVADSLASAANHVMGEGSEATPFVIIRESGAKMTSRRIDSKETRVPYLQCIYVRGLRQSVK